MILQCKAVTRLFVVFAALTLLPGCQKPTSAPSPAATIVLATTTSTYDSGLIDALLTRFTEQTGIEVKAVAVGSGQAMENGRRGDADVLMVHSPKAEEEFMSRGFGAERHRLMYNDFVIVGPPDDSAICTDATSAPDALQLIVAASRSFISRGDNSGTHARELRLWEGVDAASQEWRNRNYIDSGSGMAATLTMASEKQAFTLADRGTFLAHQDRLELAIAFEGGVELRNDYHVILVNPEKHPHVKVDAVRQFIQFLHSPETRELIAHFGEEKFGQPLFFLADLAVQTEKPDQNQRAD
jgi:tungstate transport system substrate-binding protein